MCACVNFVLWRQETEKAQQEQSVVAIIAKIKVSNVLAKDLLTWRRVLFHCTFCILFGADKWFEPQLA